MCSIAKAAKNACAGKAWRVAVVQIVQFAIKMSEYKAGARTSRQQPVKRTSAGSLVSGLALENKMLKIDFNFKSSALNCFFYHNQCKASECVRSAKFP